MRKHIKFLFALLLALLFVLPAAAQLTVPEVELSAVIVNGDQPDSYIVQVEYIFPEEYHQTFQEEFFNFSVVSPEGVGIKEIEYPEAVIKDGIENFYGHTVIQAELTGFNPETTLKSGDPVMVEANWQLCDENGLCLFPESKVIAAETDLLPREETAGGFQGGILLILLLAFAGGLLLNVMPCVLPVLSIKALSLVKQGGENRKQILTSSLLYTLGVIVSLMILALVIIIIKASGEQVGWGFQFQNPAFIIGLLTVIFLFALSLFEVFTIAAPVMRTGTVYGKKSSRSSHFFTGIIAVLLATPCSAPFLGTAAGFAFSQTAPVILSVFFMIGLGLSFPFILIGIFPAVVKKLPRPGAWMDTFREIMGFLLIGTSVWLISVLVYQGGAAFLTNVLSYLTAVAVAAWLYGKLSGPGASTLKRITGLAVGVIIIAAGAYLFFGGDSFENSGIESSGTITGAAQDYSTSSDYSGWLEFTPETVLNSIGGNRPVFVAFSAQWCMTCKANERTVLFTDEIKQFFEENNVILIYGDFTNSNPEINKWMARFGRAGVPFYTWYDQGSTDAELLPEIITKGMIKDLANLSVED